MGTNIPIVEFASEKPHRSKSSVSQPGFSKINSLKNSRHKSHTYYYASHSSYALATGIARGIPYRNANAEDLIEQVVSFEGSCMVLTKHRSRMV